MTTSNSGRVQASAVLSDQDMAFGLAWTRGQADQMGSDARVLLLIRDTEGVLRLAGAVPHDDRPGEFLRAAATSAAEGGRPIVRPAGEGRLAVAMALDMEGIAAVAAAEMQGDPALVGPLTIRQLQWGLNGVEAYLRRQLQTVPEDLKDVTHSDPEARASTGLSVFLRALETDGFRDAARAAATDLALELGAERVAIARMRYVPSRSKLIALSHAADFGRASAATDALRAAADEVLDQAEALVWPPSEDAPALSRHALETLARQSGAGSVAGVPMGDPTAPWGALVAEFADPEAANLAAPTLTLGADALAPLLALKREEDRWLPKRLWDACVNAVSVVLGPRALGWKAAVLGLAIVGVAAATVQAPARVTADAELTAEGRVLISAPFDGFLADRFVRPGEAVQQGQLMVALDDRDLTLERLRDTAARSQLLIERDTAAATGDRARFAVLNAEIAEVDARLALTEARLVAGRMTAPFDGVVTTDTTDGRIGAPVTRGDELMSLAPSEVRTVTLFVPDARIDRIKPGQTGQLRLAASPERPMSFEVIRITPVTEPRDGENTFRVTAELTGALPEDLTHGMEGAAKITTGRDLWVATWGKPFLEDIRLAVWSFWP
ncbi:MAG: efflux RND transporter periplasmic adaptor subunit [Paracoccaceae bacterium]